MGREDTDTPPGKQGARRDRESCGEPAEPSGGWAGRAAGVLSLPPPAGSTFPWAGKFLGSLAGFGVGDRLLKPKTPSEGPGWRRDNCSVNAPVI